MTKKVRFIKLELQGEIMKHSLVFDGSKFEYSNLLDEVCVIYTDLLELRRKCPHIYKDFEKMYEDMCYLANAECNSLANACNTVNLMFRLHCNEASYNDQVKGNIIFLKLSEATTEKLMHEVEQFKLWVDCILRTQP